MNISQVTKDKWRYRELLLRGDEQENMVERYLERGEMYALEDGSRALCACVVEDAGAGTLEIKNIATAPGCERRGYARHMIEYLCRRYRGRFTHLLAGTGDSPLTVPFYLACGFKRSHTVPNFFTDNYDHPIFEAGVQLVDMVYFERDI